MTPRHVAIIMDGNGRWAQSRGLPRTAGHVQGAEALRDTVRAAAELGIETLSAFAFSSDNWKRPASEVSALLVLFNRYLERERRALAEAGLRLSVIGRRDRLPPGLVEAIEATEDATRAGAALHLRLAVDYSARDALVYASIASGIDGPITRERVSSRVGSGRGESATAGDVDLLIRTGGEQRLSDFLLWECAYAELLFTNVLWPDFGADDLKRAVEAFAHRDRRFGAVAAR